MQILYEDNHLLVVNKPINMPVQEDSSKDKDLLTALKEYLKEKYDKKGNVYLGLVHCLDRPVGGVMVFAKTSKAASRLANEMSKGNFEKIYLAVSCGKANKKDTLIDYLKKDSKTNMVSVTDKQNGKKAILDYRTIEIKDDLSLLEVRLHTGRSHQIRVQLANASLPLWGDQRYNPHAKKGQQIALFAYKLSFPHPISKEILSFSCSPNNVRPFNIFKERY